MKLTTSISIPNYRQILNFDSNILSFGSCFADRIGNILSTSGFDSITNPLGISYNPHSIKKLLMLCVNNGKLDNNGYVNHSEIVAHYDIHSSLSRQTQSEFESLVNDQVQSIHNGLSKLNILILTFGSSIVYQHKDTGSIVNNCHKVRQENFNKILLSSEDMVSEYQELMEELLNLNPNLNIILTVSPVRHLRHGAIMNSRSKARLLLLCEQLEQSFDNISYFPVYEIVMDELRDYRFMAEDMVHPSVQATQYIWESFLDSFADKTTQQLVNEVNKLNKQASHRPLFPETKQAIQFQKNLDLAIATFKETNPHIKLNI